MNTNGRFQQPHLAPAGALAWTDAKTGSAALIVGGKRVVATISKIIGHRQWNLRVEGWLWAVTPDMGIARFNVIPGDKIKETPVKAFPSLSAAKKEAQTIIKDAHVS